MLAKRIIPCLDVDKGRVVKGIKLSDIEDRGDVLEVARYYDRNGADEITFLDVTSDAERREMLAQVLNQLAAEIFIPIIVGGGIRSCQDIRWVLTSGADKVAINTAALLNPGLVKQASDKFGVQATVVAIDAKRVNSQDNVRWEVMSHGGRKGTGTNVVEWAQQVEEAGAGEIILTSIDQDGSREGLDIELINTVRDAVALPIIAAGGAGSPQHMQAAFEQGRADAVMAASIFHDGEFTITQAKDFLSAHNIPVRQ